MVSDWILEQPITVTADGLSLRSVLLPNGVETLGCELRGMLSGRPGHLVVMNFLGVAACHGLAHSVSPNPDFYSSFDVEPIDDYLRARDRSRLIDQTMYSSNPEEWGGAQVGTSRHSAFHYTLDWIGTSDLHVVAQTCVIYPSREDQRVQGQENPLDDIDLGLQAKPFELRLPQDWASTS